MATKFAPLVELTDYLPDVILDIHYATPDNFCKTTLYPTSRCFVHEHVAEALVKVSRDAAKEGTRLKVYDGFRPVSVQKIMWSILPDDRYVANPHVMFGLHTRGTAVDVTLCDAEGKELPMPSHFDDLSERAHRTYHHLPASTQRNILLLERLMTRHGFELYPYEWWHFDLAGWDHYPPLPFELEELIGQA